MMAYTHDSYYGNDPKFSSSVDPEEQSNIYQGLHCLPFRLQLLAHCSMVEAHCSNCRIITAILWGVRIFRNFTVCEKSHC